jgi:hypothetical protein
MLTLGSQSDIVSPSNNPVRDDSPDLGKRSTSVPSNLAQLSEIAGLICAQAVSGFATMVQRKGLAMAAPKLAMICPISSP